MMIEGHFVVVYNMDTILSTHETASEAIRAVLQHVTRVPRGRFEIFKLGKPVKAGTLGDTIKWDD